MRLIIFTRYPEAGNVKTRLIPALGEKGAERLHREMVEHTIAQTRYFENETEVHFTGGSPKLMKRWLGDRLLYQKQTGSSLGERLENALKTAFAAGEKKVIVIGTDCPDLTSDHINKTFNLLSSSNLVLGPTFDGGYYLIGLKKLYRELFQEISWGSNKVYCQTVQAAGILKLKTVHLEKLADVDRPADLPAWLNRKQYLAKPAKNEIS